MNDRTVMIFKLELSEQCTFALTSAENLDTAIAHPDMDGIWQAIQSFLVASANISKLLFGQSGKATHRDALRRSLGVGPQSVLAKTTMRNHFEHMDERIEAWAISSERGNFVDRNVGPPGSIAGVDPADTFRQFDPVTMTVSFWGEEFDLGAMRDEVKRLDQLLP